MYHVFQKTLAGFLIVILLSSNFFMLPKSSSAFFETPSGVFTAANTFVQNISGVQSAGFDWKSFIKDDILKPLVSALAGKLLDAMSNRVVSWAATGFDGKPFYPDDYEQTFGDIFANEKDAFLGELATSSDPYVKDLFKVIGTSRSFVHDTKSIFTDRNNNLSDFIDSLDSLTGDIADLTDHDLDANSILILNEAETEFIKTRVLVSNNVDRDKILLDDQTTLLGNIDAITNYLDRVSDQTEKISIKNALEEIINTLNSLETPINLSSLTVGHENSIVDAHESLITIIAKTDGSLTTVLDRDNQRKKIEQFADNIELGGWDGYVASIGGNPYVSYFDALDEFQQGLGNTIESKAQELANNGGFFSFRECTDGDALGTKVPAILDVLPEGTPITQEVTQGCKEWETKTPGSFIESQINTALNVPTERSSRASSFGELIAGALSNLITNLTIKGLSKAGRKGASDTVAIVDNSKLTSDPIGGPEDQSTGEFQLSDPDGTFVQLKKFIDIESELLGNPTIARDRDGRILFDDNNQIVYETEIDGSGKEVIKRDSVNCIEEESCKGAINLTKMEIATIQETVDLIYDYNEGNTDTLLGALINLDQSIPGPDYNFEERIKDGLTSSKEYKKANKKCSKKGKKCDTVDNIDLQVVKIGQEIRRKLHTSGSPTEDDGQNIPSGPLAINLLSTVSDIESELRTLNQRLVAKEQVRADLEAILGLVRSGWDTQTNEYKSNVRARYEDLKTDVGSQSSVRAAQEKYNSVYEQIGLINNMSITVKNEAEVKFGIGYEDRTELDGFGVMNSLLSLTGLSEIDLQRFMEISVEEINRLVPIEFEIAVEDFGELDLYETTNGRGSLLRDAFTTEIERGDYALYKLLKYSITADELDDYEDLSEEEDLDNINLPITGADFQGIINEYATFLSSTSASGYFFCDGLSSACYQYYSADLKDYINLKALTGL